MINNNEIIYALMIVVRVMSNLVCLLVLKRANEVQQLASPTSALQQTADRLDGIYALRLLSETLDAHQTAFHTLSIRQLFMGGNHHLGEYKHCVENYTRRMLLLAVVACLLVASLAVCVLGRCRAIPATQRIGEVQATDYYRLEPHRCTWCPDPYCCPCCPEYRYPKPSCPTCPHSTCCRCCPAPGCPCCSNPDCCNSLGCNCRESHCCVTRGCLRHPNPVT